MSANIVKLVPSAGERPRTVLACMLTGHHAEGAHPGGMYERMMGEAAVRRYVRVKSRRNPLNDSGGRDDVWRQVEDVLALVPGLASSVEELDAMTHGLVRLLPQRAPGRLAASHATLAACRLEVAACGNVMRMRLLSSRSTRIITVRLEREGARRLDDRTTTS